MVPAITEALALGTDMAGQRQHDYTLLPPLG